MLYDPVLRRVQLRTFKAGRGLISTFEQDPSCDPPNLHEYDLLREYPQARVLELTQPLPRNPIPPEFRAPGGAPIYGFAATGPSDPSSWHPYLPAVISYHYPIFSWMGVSPELELRNGLLQLPEKVIYRWSAVETVICRTIKALHRLWDRTGVMEWGPACPSIHGYASSYPEESRDHAVSVVRNSLQAFQEILGFCSYAISRTPSLSSIPTDYTIFFTNPEGASDVFERLDRDPDVVYIGDLFKLLWASLGAVHRSRNFTGAVVSWACLQSYEGVHAMDAYGVPVYVRWCGIHRLKGYTQSQAAALSPWTPSIETFSVLWKDPQEYVENRKREVKKVARTSGSLESGDVLSEGSFRKPAEGEAVYGFQRIPSFDGFCRMEEQVWARALFRREGAPEVWEGFEARHLW